MMMIMMMIPHHLPLHTHTHTQPPSPLLSSYRTYSLVRITNPNPTQNQNHPDPKKKKKKKCRVSKESRKEKKKKIYDDGILDPKNTNRHPPLHIFIFKLQPPHPQPKKKTSPVAVLIDKYNSIYLSVHLSICPGSARRMTPKLEVYIYTYIHE